MFRISQHQRRGTTEVLLSDKLVTSSRVESVIPEGYRQATLEESTLRYRHYAKFRDELCDNAAWTSQKGLESSGFHEISEDGKHSSVTRSRFRDKLTREQRSYHVRGSGLVIVSSVCSLSTWEEYLLVSAESWSPGMIARVAYVKDDREVTMQQSMPKGVVVQASRFKAAERGN